MFKGIDLFSDTATRPSQAMKQAMMEAPLGDEQLGEDPTTKKLEALMAEKLGLSAALFLPSATMANQIAVKCHTEPGEEVIGHEQCHIFNAEAGGAAFHSHIQARMIQSPTGIFGAEDIKKCFRESVTYNSPKSALVIVENTTNAGGGCAWPLSKIKEVVSCANGLGLKAHLDGSRLFNAAVKNKCALHELSEGFDSVTICFSKGLGCPAGAVLAFNEQHFKRMRKFKQVFGGSLRQSGMLAAAALYALEHHIEDLALDHEKALVLAQGMQKIPGLMVEHGDPSTNMVFFALDQKHCPNGLYDAWLHKGLRFSRSSFNRFRAVTHRDISMENIGKALEIMTQTLI